MTPDGPSRRPFRFGVQARKASSAAEWRELARRLEGIGVSTMTMADHFDDALDPFVALTAAAEATETLRIGTLVLANDFRHPVVTARSAATLDLLSGGRFDLGLGAGWKPEDYAGAGIDLDPAGARIERLAEACAIVRSLLDSGSVDHQGAHYRVVLDDQPRAAARVPLVLGGGGRRMLRLAGRLADTVALNLDLRAGTIDASAGEGATFERSVEKVSWVAEGAGDRVAELELQTRVHIAAVTGDASRVSAAAARFGLTAAQARRSPHILVGTVDEICEQLRRQREDLGISYLGISATDLDELVPVIERLTGT